MLLLLQCSTMLLLLPLLGLAQAMPELAVYYESLCPYSRDFITQDLFPAYQAVGEFLNVRFIAYGNAQTSGNEVDGYTIECQHGERECYGNVVQACTVHYVTDEASQVYLMNCMAAAYKPDEAGPTCFLELQLDFAPVQACVEGPEGLSLHMMNGEEHNSLSPPAPGVPWPTWDGVGGEEVADETDRLGVVGYLCQYYYNNNLPGGVCDKKMGRDETHQFGMTLL